MQAVGWDTARSSFFRSQHTGRWLALLLIAAASTVQAQPWLEVGDRGLRSDVELLAAYGLIEGGVTSWPIPQGQLTHLLDRKKLQQSPDYIQAAARRLLKHLPGYARDLPSFTNIAEARLTNSAETIRDFGTLARDQADVHGGFVWGDRSANLSVRIGEQTGFAGQNARLTYDGSYLEVLLGNLQVYGGYVEQWYGPGWTSSLLLSNNARPFPKLGLMRNNPHAFETPWLSWFGPWQVNFFAGVLTGPRIDQNTALSSLRVSINPLPGLELALTRETQLCGRHHPCNPLDAEFHFRNDDQSTNKTNDEAGFDLKYARNFGKLTVSPYAQLMNEDTGPFAHSYTSYLGGASLAGPWRDAAAQWRLTAEYADTVATLDAFDFGGPKAVGNAYNNAGYPDGFRYRGRTLGFSLDSDSRLLSLAGQLTDSAGWTYRAVYYRADINTAALAKLSRRNDFSRNFVSAQPVTINQFEAGVSIPYRGFNFDFALRQQDAQPFPKSGGKFAAEGGLSYRF